jgi:hypothetical protein
MNNNANDPQAGLSPFLLSQESMGMRSMANAIAIAQEESELKAVQVSKQADAFEVLWAKSSQGGDTDWRLFAAECGLSVDLTGQEETDGDKTTVVGFSSAGVAFYHFGLPAAKEDEIAAMVKMQAETLLPLPAERMELTWRVGRVQNGKVAVTVAAARKEYLQRFVENVRPFNPAKILLNCEGTVKAWSELFSGDEKDAVVVSLAARRTLVCLVEDRRLSNAVILDMGTEDFVEVADSLSDFTDEDEPEQTETTERFIRDIKGALETFDYPGATRPGRPVFVLSNGNNVIKAAVSCLKSAGLDARAALPQIQKVRAQKDFDLVQLYEYRVPIGLALMALETPADGLSLFVHLYRPTGTKEKKSLLYSPKIAGTIAAVMLAAFMIVSYAIDIASPGAIEKRLQTADSSADIDLLMQRQKLIKTVALERPDLLELLNQITGSGDSGIKLDSFYFKKGQLVSIAGQAKSNDQIYEFQEALMSKNGIKDVKIQSTSRDNKSKQIKFNMTFHYKNFTKKVTRL